jgi:hypothetical protein
MEISGSAGRKTWVAPFACLFDTEITQEMEISGSAGRKTWVAPFACLETPAWEDTLSVFGNTGDSFWGFGNMKAIFGYSAQDVNHRSRQ